MNKRLLKRFKFIIIVCILILFIELCFVLYAVFYRNKESVYFDGINALVSEEKEYVTVGSDNNNDKFFEKAKISKYDENKEKTFEKLYNVGYNSAFFGAVLDSGSIVAVGSYEKSKNDHKNSVRKALIVKYNSSGDIEFEKDFKLLDNSKFTSVTKVNDGYLVTGQSIYKNTKVGTKKGGALLVKYDFDGNMIWYRTYGSSKSAIFNDLLVVSNNVFIVGTDDNYLGIICKYDLNGNLVDYNDYKSTDEIGFSGIVNINDKIYISGSNRKSNNETNAMIVEYDLNCKYQKQVVYKGKGTTRYNKLIKDTHDNLIVIGIQTKKQKLKNKTVTNLNYDGLIGKYNSNLEEISVVTYGDDRDDYFTDIKIVDGNYLVVGYSSYEDGSYLSKFIHYSDALKVLEVN